MSDMYQLWAMFVIGLAVMLGCTVGFVHELLEKHGINPIVVCCIVFGLFAGFCATMLNVLAYGLMALEYR